MILSKMRIITRLLLGFLLLTLSTLIMAGVATRTIHQLSDMTSDIFVHPFAVSTAILEVKADLLANQVRVVKLLHVKDQSQADNLLQGISVSGAHADKRLALIRERYLGSSRDIDELDKSLAEWRAAREDTVSLIRAGRIKEAMAKIDARDNVLVEKTLKEADDIYTFATNKAESFKKNAESTSQRSMLTIVVALLLLIGAGVTGALIITRSVSGSLKLALNAVHTVSRGGAEKVRVVEAIGKGDLDHELQVSEPLQIDPDSLPNDEMGHLVEAVVGLSQVQSALDSSFQKMTDSLRKARLLQQQLDWQKSGHNELNALLRGDQETSAMAENVLNFLAEYTGAGVGVFYLYNEQEDVLELVASYAYTRQNRRERILRGEGLIGQAAQEGRVICQSNLPSDYLSIGSALGEAASLVVMAIPLIKDEHLIGAIELGLFREVADFELDFVEQARLLTAIGFSINLSRQEKNLLLIKTIEQTEELRVQQEELQQSNEELEERAQMLEQQREQIKSKSLEVQLASEEIRSKARDLERISSYKSEFLANMSHELRTPLNSLMILSGLLKGNKEGNLTPKQVEFAATINSAGTDLLDLINDVLDLSKIEAGRMEYHYEQVLVQDLADSLKKTFLPIAEEKGLCFRLETASGVPEKFLGDEQRVMQILKNLLSNAFKFTSHGEIVFRIGSLHSEVSPLICPTISFSVSDTGIGIPVENQNHIFQAFKQADGTTSRKYGGTGLGLSISLELAQGMNGDIRLTSELGKGSVFSLLLPLVPSVKESKERNFSNYNASTGLPTAPEGKEKTDPGLIAPLPDDRGQLQEGEKSLLIIEDDLAFAGTLMEMVRERGFAALVATDGSNGIALADFYQPSAIILDILLPGIDGWWVMQSLKTNPRTRHIPVHFLSCLEDRQKAMAMGAVGFLTKPIDNEQLDKLLLTFENNLSRTVKHLLIVEDDLDEAKSLVALLEERDVVISVASTGQEAIKLLSDNVFDSIVLDLGLSDMSGFDLLEHVRQMEEGHRVPVIIHSGRELTYEEERELRRYTESIIIKGAKSPDRLLNEVSLFLHLVESKLHPDKQRMIRASVDKEALLEGKKVLLVDDDMRNVFSLISLLAEKDMVVVEAENGREALARLDEHPDVDVVLMDIMMPEMDGYTAMQTIRKNPQYENLPMIAMTAKALKGDHEKCLSSGASDYISKPVDPQRLFSLLRVWLYQNR